MLEDIDARVKELEARNGDTVTAAILTDEDTGNEKVLCWISTSEEINVLKMQKENRKMRRDFLSKMGLLC